MGESMDIFRLNNLYKLTKTSSRVAFAGSSVLFTGAVASQDGSNFEVEEVIVTAQKREQNLQDVPISITAITEESLSKLNIKNFADYVLQLPSVSSYQRRPGMGQIFMRGVSDGGNQNQSLTGPSVAIYVDDAPVTAIGDNLDVHIYDIDRIEVLTGPQGTLYGAASQAGNLRIITKKPINEFDAGANMGIESTSGGSGSNLLEGFVNIPLSQNSAIRLVGYRDKDGGYIDSVQDSITYPLSGITKTSANFVESDFNESVVEGYKAALRVNLSDSWTFDANLMSQQTETDGVWDHNPTALGDYNVSRFFDDSTDDDWSKFTATITGDLGFADLTFTTSTLDRDLEYLTDYSAYAAYSAYVEAYYTCYAYYYGDNCIDPSIQYENDTNQEIETREIRLTSKNQTKLNWIIGSFYTENTLDYNTQWRIPGILDALKVPLSVENYYQTDQVRVDEETALFGELYYQLTDQLKLTLGYRRFENETSLKGFVGTVFWPSYIGGTNRADNVNSRFSGKDSVSKFNLSYDINETTLVYLTLSEGYRPGGANRTTEVGATYDSDFLESTEIGLKTTLMDGRFRFNGAIYQQDWNDIQLAFFDPNISLLGLVDNLGQAESNGFEFDSRYIINDKATISVGYSSNDAELKENYFYRGTLRVAAGQDLPLTPDVKYNINLDYEVNENSFGQINYTFTDEMFNSDVFLGTREIQDSYSIVNASWTLVRGNKQLQFYVNNLTDETAELGRNYEDYVDLITVNRPRSIGIKFSWLLDK